MSLKGFHILFITISTLFAFGFGGWCVDAYLNEGGDIYIGLSGTSFLAGGGLIWYGITFLKKIKRLHL